MLITVPDSHREVTNVRTGITAEEGEGTTAEEGEEAEEERGATHRVKIMLYTMEQSIRLCLSMEVKANFNEYSWKYAQKEREREREREREIERERDLGGLFVTHVTFLDR